MDRMEITMVKVASMAARMALGRENPVGHKIVAQIEWKTITSAASCRVASVTWYRPAI